MESHQKFVLQQLPQTSTTAPTYFCMFIQFAWLRIVDALPEFGDFRKGVSKQRNE